MYTYIQMIKTVETVHFNVNISRTVAKTRGRRTVPVHVQGNDKVIMRGWVWEGVSERGSMAASIQPGDQYAGHNRSPTAKKTESMNTRLKPALVNSPRPNYKYKY